MRAPPGAMLHPVEPPDDWVSERRGSGKQGDDHRCPPDGAAADDTEAETRPGPPPAVPEDMAARVCGPPICVRPAHRRPRRTARPGPAPPEPPTAEPPDAEPPDAGPPRRPPGTARRRRSATLTVHVLISRHRVGHGRPSGRRYVGAGVDVLHVGQQMVHGRCDPIEDGSRVDAEEHDARSNGATAPIWRQVMSRTAAFFSTRIGPQNTR